MEAPSQTSNYKITPQAEELLERLAKEDQDDATSKKSGRKKPRYTPTDKLNFLNLRHLPGEVNEVQAGWLLGEALEDHVPVLSVAGHLPHLGHADAYGNSEKSFLTAFIQQCNASAEWHSFANDLVKDFNRYKNKRPPKYTKYFQKIYREKLKKKKAGNCQLAKP